MPNCTAACQHSEEECLTCLAGGIPKIVADGNDLADLAHAKKLIPSLCHQRIQVLLSELETLWREHFPAVPSA